MALEAGHRLGPYEIIAPIGAGGMGEVYRALDTRLDRSVAIKVLNSQLVASAEVRARFEREAKVISQLQHPNICVLHDVGNENGTDFLVMEFLEGESLAERLRKGPLASQQLLRIAIDVADALEKAHRAGVVHRDLKPGNVMLTRSGAKLLDFGLAKPFAAGATAGAQSSSASVFSAALTQTSPAPSPGSPLSTAGAVIGTVQYMSPEQIQGLEANERSDIFAFGVMLFEMATGKRAFEGKTQASIVGQILAVDPPSASTLRPETPPGLDRVIRICLEKDPDERIQTAHDLKLELQRIAEAPVETAQGPAAKPEQRRGLLSWAVAAALAVAAIGLGIAYWQTQGAPQVSVHSYVLPPDKSDFAFLSNWAGPVVISPDGQRIAFVAKKAGGGDGMLWVQPLNSPTAQPMAGTEGAGYPFWSHDNRYVAFFANGKLQKVDANGGPPQTLCNVNGARGGSWNQDDVILFTPNTNSGLFRVPAAGGTPVPVTDLDAKAGEVSHRWPMFLPDGKHFIFWVQLADASGGAIYAGSLDSKQYKSLVHTASSGAYAPPGYLLFVRDGALMAQKLNPRKLELEGDASPVADHVAVNTSTYRSILTVSDHGTLIYLATGQSSGTHLNWYGRDGKAMGAAAPDAALYLTPALSPDGKRLAVSIESGAASDIWVIDLQRQTKTRLTFGPGSSTWPIWSPDGRWIYYQAVAPGSQGHIERRAADGTGNSETLLTADGREQIPSSVTADAQYLSYFGRDAKNPQNGYDAYVLPLFGDRKPIPQLATRFNEVVPRLSPDGKWLAYMSNESGRYEVYVKPFPGDSGKYQVSTSGGSMPRWRVDGRELFFTNAVDSIMAVDVRPNGSALELGTPHQVLNIPFVSGAQGPFDITADGKKILVNQIGESKVLAPLTLVTNWTADLKK